MLRIIAATALLALAPAAGAATISDTHERVAMPAGKSVVAFRPLKAAQTAPAVCHADTHKALSCTGRQTAVARQQEPVREAQAELHGTNNQAFD